MKNPRKLSRFSIITLGVSLAAPLGVGSGCNLPESVHTSIPAKTPTSAELAKATAPNSKTQFQNTLKILQESSVALEQRIQKNQEVIQGYRNKYSFHPEMNSLRADILPYQPASSSAEGRARKLPEISPEFIELIHTSTKGEALLDRRNLQNRLAHDLEKGMYTDEQLSTGVKTKLKEFEIARETLAASWAQEMGNTNSDSPAQSPIDQQEADLHLAQLHQALLKIDLTEQSFITRMSNLAQGKMPNELKN